MKELLANEEDTVVVDQEIAKIEAGAAKPESVEKPESKEPKKEEASTDAKSAPAEAENKPESKPESKPAPEPSKPSPTPQPKKESQPSKQPAPAATGPVLGSREERRVRIDARASSEFERLRRKLTNCI